MALSLESLFRPMSDLLLGLFPQAGGGTVRFYFEQFGSALAEEDFRSPQDPEHCVQPAIAVEKLSELVNSIPILGDDGMSLVLSLATIDDTYFYRLLSPSLPFLPPGLSDDSRQALLDSFSRMKADALADWEAMALESLSGLRLKFRPAFATPQSWYDRSAASGWTRHEFAATQPEAPILRAGGERLWRLRLSDDRMMRALKRPALQPALQLTVAPAQPLSRARLGMIEANPRLEATVARPTASLQQTYLRRAATLNLGQRLAIHRELGELAPKESVRSTSAQVSFDYCFVRIRRPWFAEAFLASKQWFLPAVTRGELSRPGPIGNLPAIPIAFLAIRNLSIEARWGAEDAANAAQATGFGPFQIQGVLQDGKLSHPGLQVAGWLLQDLPDLPPNDPPP